MNCVAEPQYLISKTIVIFGRFDVKMTQLRSIPGFQWLDLRLISDRLSFLNHCNESQNFDT